MAEIGNERCFYVSSESVTEGHPDKVCDQIADGILDAYLEKDPKARVAIEVMASRNTVIRAKLHLLPQSTLRQKRERSYGRLVM